MCGIAGLWNVPTEESIYKTMISTMARRGPDASGIYINDAITLLHTRLAIIDPQQGKQPMLLTYENQDYILVYNGELYNTSELRQELVSLGHRFKGHSDTEVVLHSYVQWKHHCVDHFNGIYAFAVWETGEKRLFLARDRIGVKPLFYSFLGEGFLFASEIKTILAHPGMHPCLDSAGAAQLILLGPGRLPGSGVFHSIQELEPGCRGYLCGGKFKQETYWKLTDEEHTQSFEETAEQVRFLVLDAISRQMVSDVPIGTFLSGGLDSSLISAVCAEQMHSRGEVLHTFSVDYENSEKYYTPNRFQPESDNHYINLMVKHIHSDHHTTILSPEALFEVLEDATIARDLPGMGDVDFSLLAFCKEIRREAKVALSGECADEIFGGYPWYRDPLIRAAEGFPWAQNTAMRSSLLGHALTQTLNPTEFVMDAYRQTCAGSDILPGNSPEDRRTKEMVNLNFRWFMQTLLDRKDRMSMYHSLEVRVPFCDHRIAQYLYHVPWKYKDHQNVEKGLLRYAMRGILPEQVLYRKKSPYPKTFDPNYERMVSQRLQEVMQSDSALFHIVDRKQLTDLLECESPWPWYGQLMRRPQIIAYMLQLEFWLRAYKVEFLF